MDAIERDALAKQQADEIHRAIGRFVAAFSGAEGNVQTCIIFILNSAGLAGPRGQMISRVLIADLTAEPLRALLQSLVGEALVLTQEVADTFDDALKRYKKLIEVRNDVMHATWFVAYGAEDSEDFSQASSLKFRKNKSGARVGWTTWTAVEPDKFSDEADALADAFRRLNARRWHQGEVSDDRVWQEHHFTAMHAGSNNSTSAKPGSPAMLANVCRRTTQRA
jgi:hypothetical protein